jgi:hypothetical protein
MILTADIIRSVQGEADAQAVYREVCKTGDLQGFARQYAFDDDHRVARNALWTLTKATDKEIAQLQPMLDELIDQALKTDSSSVRRLSLNIIDRLEMKEEDLRSDLYDFCLEHAVDVEELPAIQAISMKIAFRISTFYPELMAELKRILEGMEIEYYKPAVKSIRTRILTGKYQ